LVPPRRARALPWQDFALTPAERDTKASAIGVYETQLRLTSSFMLSFVKRNEIYSSAPLLPAQIQHDMAVKIAAAENLTALSSHAVK
ncbi:MAG TPA: hypothetical protein VIH77_05385, partial [Steroidobacteraceae bacterium]